MAVHNQQPYFRRQSDRLQSEVHEKLWLLGIGYMVRLAATIFHDAHRIGTSTTIGLDRLRTLLP